MDSETARKGEAREYATSWRARETLQHAPPTCALAAKHKSKRPTPALSVPALITVDATLTHLVHHHDDERQANDVTEDGDDPQVAWVVQHRLFSATGRVAGGAAERETGRGRAREGEGVETDRQTERHREPERDTEIEAREIERDRAGWRERE